MSVFSVKSSLARAAGLAILALAVWAPAALALPELEVDLSNEPTTLPRSDEGMFYTATVTNTAPETPAVGDELTCQNSTAKWFNVESEADFDYRWLRNGAPIAGETAKTHVLVAADEGAGVQCEVTGKNADKLKTIALTAVNSAVATAGSNVITGAFTATGSGTLSAGSKTIGSLAPNPPEGTLGAFAVGQTITAPGIPAGTTITAVLPGSLEISAAATASGSQSLSAGSQPFEVGQTVRSNGASAEHREVIPPETTITAISGTTLTLSKNATSSRSIRVEAVEQVPAPLAAAAVSLPPVVIGAPPSPGVPAPVSDPRKVESRPHVTGPQDGATVTCTAPSNWSAATSFTYQWLRDGVPIAGATGSEYTPVEAEDKYAVLQCEVFGKSGTGAAPGGGVTASISPSSNWVVTIEAGGAYALPEGAPNNNPTAWLPGTTFSNTTSGPVALDVELPPGGETLVTAAAGAGWSCTTQLPAGASPASASCTREDQLPPGGASFPPLSVAVSLGADAPDIGVATATVSGGGAAAPATDTATYAFTAGLPFGLIPGAFEAAVFDQAGNDHTQAGGHPYRAFTTIGLNTHKTAAKDVYPVGRVKDVLAALPRGFVGNARATPELCGSIEEVVLALCPERSLVGGVDVYSFIAEAPKEDIYPDGGVEELKRLPVYALEPEFGAPAQFAFAISSFSVPYTFVAELRAEEGYALSLRSAPVLTAPPLYGFNANLCDFGGEIEGSGRDARFAGCKKAGQAGANPVPLFTNPTRCSGPPPTTELRVNSWEDPETIETDRFSVPPITGCDQVKFEPKVKFEPTSDRADSPTGLDVEVTVPSEGLVSPTGIAQAHLKRVRVTFPQGMAINPSAGHGLGYCTAEQVKLKTNDPISCPASSKIGTMEVDSPIIESKLVGDVYIAKQGEIEGALTGFYVVFDSKKDGILIKIPAKIEPDPRTGRLVVTIDDSPEAPFSSAALHFAQGPRAALTTPPKCGIYRVKAELVPWTAVDLEHPSAAETVTENSAFRVTRGPDGGACPDGELAPQLEAGSAEPLAGKTSPFLVRLHREDGSARFSSLKFKAPLGLTAYLKGVPYCPDSAIASISTAPQSGQGEIDHPSCPAASEIGTASAGAGAGPDPFYVNAGHAYLAGPYKGAPASIVVVAPAVAGPLDLGSVVVRNAIYIDPETTQITVVSDPIPTILHGIPTDIRDIRVTIDRPHFALNPTSCEEKSALADVTGEGGETAQASNRFQVGGCGALRLKPRSYTRLFGPTGRAGHPRLRGVLVSRPGDANLKGAVVTIPRSEFLDQAHIRTICTRVQFAAKKCPKGSIYGHVRAVTPLLDEPLSGPVYLRSSNHYLPDLVATVRGPDYQPIEASAVARIDSIKGQIRASFEAIPDVPLSKIVIDMRGGKRGLLVNSRNICSRRYRVRLALSAHNGRSRVERPPLRNTRCGKARKHKRQHHRHKAKRGGHRRGGGSR